MIKLPPLSASCQGLHTQGHSLVSANRAAQGNQQDAAFAAIATRGHWNNQYMDLVIPSLPKLPIWPAGRGLVIVEGERADYYNAQGSRPVERSHIDFDNDVVLKRVTDNHYNVLLPSGERDIARDGDCLFRAVITSWNRGGLKDAMTDAFISELREHVADYISQNWDTFKDFVEQDNEPILKAPKHVQPNALQSKSHPFPVTSRVNQAVEVFSLPLMNNVTTVPAFPSSMGTQLGASDNASRVTLSNHRDAAVAAISTMGHWDSQYMDLIIPSLPKMLQWPAWRGLVIMEEERIQRYDADGSQPVEKDNIDPNDILVTRCADQYMSGRYPGMDLFLPKNGDGFFRAVLAGVYGKELDGRTEAKLVQVLRGQVADYVRENWDDFKDFVIQDGVPLAGDVKLEPLSTAAPSQPPATPGGTPAMEMFHQASRIGKASFIPMLMAQVEALVVPALEAIRGMAFTEKDMHGLAVVLRLVNRTIADAPPAEKAEWIERCLQDLFSSDAKHPVSKAEAILAHRNSPALKPVVNELMTFMESTAQQLKGDALARFGQLLGVDIAVDGTDRGIARFFSRESATSGPINQFRARFESLREEFGMSF